MAKDEQKIETPGDFLTALGERLRAAPDVDTELADILIATLLTDSPVKDATTTACDAVAKLAEKRALPPKELTDG
jgi:hypothetical protein